MSVWLIFFFFLPILPGGFQAEGATGNGCKPVSISPDFWYYSFVSYLLTFSFSQHALLPFGIFLFFTTKLCCFHQILFDDLTCCKDGTAFDVILNLSVFLWLTNAILFLSVFSYRPRFFRAEIKTNKHGNPQKQTSFLVTSSLVLFLL